jgi:hypothetical protein
MGKTDLFFLIFISYEELFIAYKKKICATNFKNYLGEKKKIAVFWVVGT